MHETREKELELQLGDMVNHRAIDGKTCDVQFRNVEVRAIAGTMDIEIDLMYVSL